MSEQRRGFLLGAASYALWGLFPLYWPLLEPAGAVEILANRVIWSLVVVAALVVATSRGARLRAVLADRRTRLILTAAALVIAVNWGTYIWGVNNGHVVETSLGYFINPLVTVLMGVVFLGERLRRLQWAALLIAFAAVVELTVELGRPPWVALVLAFSFGTYGLAKKKAGVGAIESLTFETMALTPLALGYVLVLETTGEATFGHAGWGQALLMVGTGLVTAVPLLCFGGAATRISMTLIGLLQYLAPTIQFFLGVLVFDEPMTAPKWVGFALVWTALAILTAESLRHRRQVVRRAAEAVAV